MELHVETFGAGPNVVALHGTPQAPGELAALLSKVGGYRFHVVHLPGYGGSRDVRSDGTLDEVETAIAAAVARADASEHDLIGYSGGSFRAFRTVARGTLAPRRLIALGPIPFVPPELSAAWGGLPRELDAATAVLRAAVEGMYTERFRSSHPDAVRDAVEAAVEIGAPLVLHELDTYRLDDFDLAAALPQIRIPVAMRVGALDANTPAALASAALGLLPSATLDVVPDLAHALPVEDADATARWIATQLSPTG